MAHLISFLRHMGWRCDKLIPRTSSIYRSAQSKNWSLEIDIILPIKGVQAAIYWLHSSLADCRLTLLFVLLWSVWIMTFAVGNLWNASVFFINSSLWNLIAANTVTNIVSHKFFRSENLSDNPWISAISRWSTLIYFFFSESYRQMTVLKTVTGGVVY